MLLKRTLTTLVLTALVWFGMKSTPVFNVAVTAVTVLGLYEFFTMLERKGISIYKYFGIGMGAVIPLSIMYRFELTKRWELLFILLALIFLIVMQFKRRESSGAVVGISTTVFGILYVSWFFSFIVRIRMLPDGFGYLLSLIAVTKAGDIGAFLIGSRLGRTPLIPRISPKKSLEGAVGGFLFSLGAAFACKPLLGPMASHAPFIGLALGFLGQLGDLSESLMKRDCQIKDSAALFPGIGGVLDLIDSLLFTAPAFYFYVSIVLNYM